MIKENIFVLWRSVGYFFSCWNYYWLEAAVLQSGMLFQENSLSSYYWSGDILLVRSRKQPIPGYPSCCSPVAKKTTIELPCRDVAVFSPLWQRLTNLAAKKRSRLQWISQAPPGAKHTLVWVLRPLLHFLEYKGSIQRSLCKRRA